MDALVEPGATWCDAASGCHSHTARKAIVHAAHAARNVVPVTRAGGEGCVEDGIDAERDAASHVAAADAVVAGHVLVGVVGSQLNSRRQPGIGD